MSILGSILSSATEFLGAINNTRNTQASSGTSVFNPSQGQVSQQPSAAQGIAGLLQSALDLGRPFIQDAVSRPQKPSSPPVPDSVKNDPRVQNLLGSYGFTNNTMPQFKNPSNFQRNFPTLFDTLAGNNSSTVPNPLDNARALYGQDFNKDISVNSAQDTTAIREMTGMLELPDQDSFLIPNERTPLKGITQSHLTNLEPYSGVIEQQAKKYNVDPTLLKAIIVTESDVNPQAVSPKGAIGLAQIMPATAKGLAGRTVTKEELMDPVTNISLSAKLLGELSDTYGRSDDAYEKIISAYNAGPKAVDNGAYTRYPETAGYYRNVKNRLSQLNRASAKATVPNPSRG